MSDHLEKNDPLAPLREFTAARIAIGRVGNSIPLKQSMEFNLAHAHARDAVYSTLDLDGLTEKIKIFDLPILHLHSQASTRHKYLKRPDLGRLLSEDSHNQLHDSIVCPDICIIIADGLSAAAVNENTFGLLKILIPMLSTAKLTIAPLCLVEQGRVAIGDDIAGGLKAKLSIILIGERPGLSSADSMGAYLTFNPSPGLTDESRNCISNIRKGGLSYRNAANKIFYLVNEAIKRKLSGVALKDNAGLLT
ncbi:ethanolamine ammonia-lyase subunit EutC [Mucilaginibacter sp. BJC16-A38]|uniref:ethanolamine ammonia-lyase subunit EutC n=1 Tax=Mucilaginibacter phenanthrenivorans TaxID=1234842 RepID=UPI00215756D2|nr:ethanolamine ammonia-lyase subunit EutC [Mucilaginibacter phenanthrenivorans]MCR8556660.1 ethanolamine ammonia-lyase subunit EutC [Mucilaginibacter phenanthrenivorans]